MTRIEQDVQDILRHTKPEQQIGLQKLAAHLDLQYNRLLRALAVLRYDGLATVKRRYGHKDGALVTFYKTPLPVEQRDKIGLGTAARKPHHVPADEVFAVTRTFQVKSGVYTAKQLRKLARAVLTELGELT